MILLLLLSTEGSSAQESTVADFSAVTLNGETVSLSEYLKDGPVYLNFWATWCEPCKAELKMLKPLAEKFRERGLTVLTVNTDDPKTSARVKAYVRSQKYTFPILLDPDGRIFKLMNGSQVPFGVLIGRNGAVISRHTGYFAGDERSLEAEFESILSGPVK
jgi:peroxiredoxin